MQKEKWQWTLGSRVEGQEAAITGQWGPWGVANSVLAVLRNPLMLQTGAECGRAERSCHVLCSDSL